MATLQPSPLTTAVRRARNAWMRVRPFHTPHYLPDTPRVGSGHWLDVYLPPTAQTLGAAAMSDEVATRVRDVLGKLTPFEGHEAGIVYYDFARAKFGANWRFADILTAACAAAGILRPQTYLEIGVWRGRSAAVVGATWPSTDIYGFDLWVPDYHGVENPGPEFVQQELQKVGHTGNVTLISGDSQETLPKFLSEHPDLYFDLISIDGGKSIGVWSGDLANALPRLKMGGIVLTDDLSVIPQLRRVWNKVVARNIRYVSWEFIDAGFGVAAGIRTG